VRPHGPAQRAGELGPRVFFQGPRVFHHGPATPTNDQPRQPPPSPTSDTATPPAIHVGTADLAPETPIGTEPEPRPWHHNLASPHRPIEEFVVPSEHEQHSADEETRFPSAVAPIVEIYRPSTGHTLLQPDDDHTPPPPPSRPETEDRGDADADPI
jgi:hypothetical protein